MKHYYNYILHRYYDSKFNVIAMCAPNGHLEVPVYFLKAKGGYTVRKMEKRNGYSIYW
jgi:hypothetical protein